MISMRTTSSLKLQRIVQIRMIKISNGINDNILRCLSFRIFASALGRCPLRSSLSSLPPLGKRPLVDELSTDINKLEVGASSLRDPLYGVWLEDIGWNLDPKLQSGVSRVYTTRISRATGQGVSMLHGARNSRFLREFNNSSAYRRIECTSPFSSTDSQ